MTDLWQHSERAIIEVGVFQGEPGWRIVPDADHQILKERIRELESVMAEKESLYQNWKSQVVSMVETINDLQKLVAAKETELRNRINTNNKQQRTIDCVSSENKNLRQDLRKTQGDPRALNDSLKTADTWNEIESQLDGAVCLTDSVIKERNRIENALLAACGGSRQSAARFYKEASDIHPRSK